MAQLLAMSEFLHSTVLIETEEGRVASGLVVEHEDRVVLLTAAHAVPDASEARFLIGSSQTLGRSDLTIPRVDDRDLASEDDLAIYQLPNERWPLLDSGRISQAGMHLSQDVLMVGYPGGNSYTVHVSGTPNVLPMVKKGVIAAMTSTPDRIYLDLIANPGFSGSPLLMAPHDARHVMVAGMVIQTAVVPNDRNELTLDAAGISVAVPASLLLKHLRNARLVA
jgi:S1-C subfamily serine protease